MPYLLHHPAEGCQPDTSREAAPDVIAAYFSEPIEWILERIKGTAARRAAYGLPTHTLYLTKDKRIVATIQP